MLKIIALIICAVALFFYGLSIMVQVDGFLMELSRARHGVSSEIPRGCRKKRRIVIQCVKAKPGGEENREITQKR